MPVDIPQLLLNSAAAFGIGVLWYEFTRWSFKMLINLQSEEEEEDVSSTDSSEEDSSFVYSVEEEEVKKGEGKKSDDKPRLVIRTLKVQKKN